jgi:hypothetical protein
MKNIIYRCSSYKCKRLLRRSRVKLCVTICTFCGSRWSDASVDRPYAVFQSEHWQLPFEIFEILCDTLFKFRAVSNSYVAPCMKPLPWLTQQGYFVENTGCSKSHETHGLLGICVSWTPHFKEVVASTIPGRKPPRLLFIGASQG